MDTDIVGILNPGLYTKNITRILNTPRLKIMNGCPDFYPMVDANSSRVADPDPSPSGSNPREKIGSGSDLRNTFQILIQPIKI